MHPFSLSSLFLLLLLLLPPPPSTATHTRRTLQQSGFFPEASSPPPANPPSAATSFSTPTPTQQPFFPSIPSPPPRPTPPPPPPPPTITNFPSSLPVNISSLNLPHAPKSNPIPSILFVTAAAVVLLAAIALFFYLRRRRPQNSYDSKSTTTRSDNTNSVDSRPNELPRRIGRSPPTSSEFLYVGTIVDSHGGVNPLLAPIKGGVRKLDSPDLSPLPPLDHRKNLANANVASEEDVFFSPVELSSSIGTRSAARGDLSSAPAAAAVDHLVESSGSQSSCTTSSYSTRSVSLSTSPPVSLSPTISLIPKSPELTAVQTAPAPTLAGPQRPVVMTQLANLTCSKSSEESLDSSARTSNASSIGNAEGSPVRVYTVVWSKVGGSSSGGETATMSQSILSKTQVEEEFKNGIGNAGLSQFPQKRNSRSPSVSSSFSSPERRLGKAPDSSPLVFNPFHPNVESQAKPENSIQKSVAAPPPPPPRLPLPPGGYRERLVSSPSISQPNLKAPGPNTPLKPPSVSPIELHELHRNSESFGKNEEVQKPKLKPLRWDKVRASSSSETVWDQLKSSSFRLNEEMIETLFVADTQKSNSKESTGRPVLYSANQENMVLDPKKAQNIAISLRALNVNIDAVCDALSDGNADALGTELLESLLKMAPTKDEERRLKEHKDDSLYQLGPAERFLKAVLDIPSAFKRVDAMIYIANFESDVQYLRRSFDILEAACEELRNSRMFLKLLEAVLKTGNRMNKGTNRGDAQAFKLDTLLKLVDVKGADGKTTLLHFVVQEIIKIEGARFSGGYQNPNTTIDADAKCRKLGLQVVSSLSSELRNVKKAAAMDSDVLVGDVAKLSQGIENIRELARVQEGMGLNKTTGKFSESMKRFTRTAEEEIIRVQAQKSVALSLVKEITEAFHGSSAKEEAHPFRIFMVVRDFLTILDRVCHEVGVIIELTVISSTHKFPLPVDPLVQPHNTGLPRRQTNRSSFDEEDDGDDEHSSSP